MSSFFSDRKRVAAYAIMLVAFIIVGFFAPHEQASYYDYAEAVEAVDFDAGEELPEELQVDYGAWTLMIPALMFIFVLLTKSFLEAFISVSYTHLGSSSNVMNRFFGVVSEVVAGNTNNYAY